MLLYIYIVKQELLEIMTAFDLYKGFNPEPIAINLTSVEEAKKISKKEEGVYFCRRKIKSETEPNKFGWQIIGGHVYDGGGHYVY